VTLKTSLLPESDLEDLVEAWVRYHTLHLDEDFWAFDRVNELVQSDARVGWQIVIALVQRAPDEVLGAIGAGPLEDLIGHHPDEVIERVARQAQEDWRFLQALCVSWFTEGQLPPHVERRLLEVTNGVIRILGLSV
jgi:uncharacterized protein DUF6869